MSFHKQKRGEEKRGHKFLEQDSLSQNVLTAKAEFVEPGEAPQRLTRLSPLLLRTTTNKNESFSLCLAFASSLHAIRRYLSLS